MAYVLSSISGNVISAASAGYAPTNSGDVSAIASAYQVVSATGTQLYASTAHVTSINNAPISASRAGNAANAAMATSAYYDGTGRLISSLPDSATVSAIASAYAESAASSKQDELTFAYDADSAISSINGSALAGGGGGTGDYVEKSALTVAIGSAVSASAGGTFVQGYRVTAGEGSFAQGYCFPTQQNIAVHYSLAQGQDASASAYSLAQGLKVYGDDYGLAQGYSVSARHCSFAQGDNVSATYTSLAHGRGVIADNSMVAFGKYNLTTDGSLYSAAFVIGDGTATGARHDLMLITKDGEITMYSSTADTTGTGILSSIRAISAAATGGVDSATVSAIASAYASSKQDSSAMSAYQLTADMSAYAYESSNSAKLDTSAIECDTASAITAIGGSSVGAAQVVTATATGAMLHYGSAATGTSTSISGVNGYDLIAATLMPGAWINKADSYQFEFAPSASMFGSPTGIFAPLQYATGACIGMSGSYFRGYLKGNEYYMSDSRYGYVRGESHNNRGNRVVAQSTASASAQIYAKGNTAQIQLGTTAGTAKIDTADINLWNSAASSVSAKQDSSAMTSYALSADVSSTIDTVSAQSANWGGSALALSAGPGIKMTKTGDTLVASIDETVLWSGKANTTSFTGELSEAISHFQYVDFYAAPNTAYMESRAHQCARFKAGVSSEPSVFYYVRTENMESNVYIGEIMYVNTTNGTAFTFANGCRWNGTAYTTGISAYRGAITKIVGVNRLAED